MVRIGSLREPASGRNLLIGSVWLACSVARWVHLRPRFCSLGCRCPSKGFGRS